MSARVRKPICVLQSFPIVWLRGSGGVPPRCHDGMGHVCGPVAARHGLWLAMCVVAPSTSAGPPRCSQGGPWVIYGLS